MGVSERSPGVMFSDGTILLSVKTPAVAVQVSSFGHRKDRRN
jgi:hypothetical protein